MKKITATMLAFIFFLISGLQVVQAAEPWPEPEALTVRTQYLYQASRDVYRLSYGESATADSSRLNFWSKSGNYFKLDSTNQPSGIYYLTCNGTYILELFKNGTKIRETKQIVTTKIVQPTCQSYSNADQAKNDLLLTETITDGKIKLNWSAQEGATKYEILKDGEKVGETQDTTYNVDSSGAYTVVAKDENGNILGESDYEPPDPFPTAGGGGCDACKWLTDLLACPAWDQYMGDLTNAIKDALPPPPDWDSIANTFVGKFSDYFGDVPVPPSIPQIENNIRPPLPEIEKLPAGILPLAPPEFNDGPIKSDITSGEEIEVEDGSEPIEIYEPNKYINSDPVGQMVLPGDDRNHSDGIKTPDKIETGTPLPVPSGSQGGDVPPADIPIPSGNDGIIPIPTGSDGIIPIPK